VRALTVTADALAVHAAAVAASPAVLMLLLAATTLVSEDAT